MSRAMRRGILGGGGEASTFAAGNQSVPDLYTLVQAMADDTSDMATPAAGGTLTVNGVSLGSYDYVIKNGNQTVSSFNNASWYTTTQDSRVAFVVVKGDLTINAGQVFRPSHRKLFVVIYVTGNLIVNGEISMSQRGANHTASAGNVAAGAIRIITGTYSGVTNPQVPAAGGDGATAVSNDNGNDGANGTNGGTGGGGGGGATASDPAGPGAAGTSFSGGSGGAGRRSGSATTPPEANGGRGGDSTNSGGSQGEGGGAGNPGGTGGDGADDGGDGTGGVGIIFCDGIYSGSGSVTAAGAPGGDGTPAGGGNNQGGGGSGGGSWTIVCGTDSGPSPSAEGGIRGPGDNVGGKGGDGDTRKLLFAA